MPILSSFATGLDAYLRECGFVGKLPQIAGTYSGGLVICGDAACIWDDLERFGCKSTINRGRVLKPGWQFMTVNKAVETFAGDIEHAYSNEAGFLRKCIAARRQEYTREFSGPRHVHSIGQGADWTWPFAGHGTSGLGACLVGLALGYDKIVICGMPLDDGPHNGEPPWRATRFASSEAAGGQRTGRNTHWQKAIDIAFDGRVRSMSGRTKDWLGEPG